jgi:hypothetical protein
MVSGNFCLFSYVSGKKLGGTATGHAKNAGWRPDLKFYDYTQNSSEKLSKFKNQSEHNSKVQDFYSICEI